MFLVGFSTARDPVSTLIRWLTGSRVSHAFLVDMTGFYGLPVALEADEWGWHLTPYAKRIRTGTIVVQVAIEAVDLAPAMPRALGWLTEPYDFGGLFGMAFVLLGRRLRRRWHNPTQSARALFCSEAVTKILQLAGYPGASDLAASDTSPQDLLAFLLRSGARVL